MKEPISITSRSHLMEWLKYGELLLVERWKDGVKRLHIRHLFNSPPSFNLVYCADEHLFLRGSADDNPAPSFGDDSDK